MSKNIIPVFFAIDNNYLPFLAVSLQSIKENASKQYIYKIHVLNTGVEKEKEDKILELQDDCFQISFVDVSKKLDEISKFIGLRDYYTCTTYFRLFIAGMFPEYDKALYLDADTVVPGDLSELYNTDLGNNLISAVLDETVLALDIFQDYVKNALGVPHEQYFNAGVILMNLKLFREEDFYGKFNALLKTYKFSVAQDQDYLNVLCKDRVLYLGVEWNKMPMPPVIDKPKLIHYNLTRKPWHYDETLYSEIFWEYAKKTAFYQEILDVKKAFTKEDAQKDALCEQNLVAMAKKEAEAKDNYYNLYVKK